MTEIPKHFKVTGKTLFLCDMRPGFSEDGIEVSLPKGDYQLTLEPASEGNLVGFSLILIGQKPDREEARGTFTIDMAQIGILDRKAFLKFFKGDVEALSEWSDNASDEKKASWGGSMEHSESGLEALYVKVGSDCKCAVQLLRSKSRTVGIRVIPQPPEERPDDKKGGRHWTWVEVKCAGIKEAWCFSDDRDYEPEFEEVLDSAIFEVSSIDEDDSIAFLDTKDINADVPISKYRKQFQGISKIEVFEERAGESRKLIAIPSWHLIPKLGPETTPRKLAKIVFELFQAARTWSDKFYVGKIKKRSLQGELGFGS